MTRTQGVSSTQAWPIHTYIFDKAYFLCLKLSEALTLYVFTKFEVTRWILFGSSWTFVSRTKIRMDGSAKLWFDEEKTKIWILGGRDLKPNGK